MTGNVLFYDYNNNVAMFFHGIVSNRHMSLLLFIISLRVELEVSHRSIILHQLHTCVNYVGHRL